jgi:hypothetical protein
MTFRTVSLAIISIALLTSFAAAQHPLVHPQITQSVDETRNMPLKGNTHPLARPENDRGLSPQSLQLDRVLPVLQRSPQQESALRALLDQQQDKFSPNYHAWLTPDQFGQQFGPADQDIQAVTSWLASHGFQVNRVARGRGTIEFSGTVGQVQATFHAEIHQYDVNGKLHWANASDPEIPAAFFSLVAGIMSLHNFPRKPMHVLPDYSHNYDHCPSSAALTDLGPKRLLSLAELGGFGVIGVCLFIPVLRRRKSIGAVVALSFFLFTFGCGGGGSSSVQQGGSGGGGNGGGGGGTGGDPGTPAGL